MKGVISLMTGLAEVEVGTNEALVGRSSNRKHKATITLKVLKNDILVRKIDNIGLLKFSTCYLRPMQQLLFFCFLFPFTLFISLNL